MWGQPYKRYCKHLRYKQYSTDREELIFILVGGSEAYSTSLQEHLAVACCV